MKSNKVMLLLPVLFIMASCSKESENRTPSTGLSSSAQESPVTSSENASTVNQSDPKKGHFEPEELPENEVLIVNKWMLEDVKKDGISIWAGLPDCEKHKNANFMNTYKYSLYDLMPCSGEEITAVEGTWAFTKNDTHLQIKDDSGNVTEGKITTLKADILSVLYDDGREYTYRPIR